jgi:hypothetical protein
MRRLTWLLAAAAVALVATGIAAGDARDRSTSAVSATFTATTVGHRATTTCTSGDGTFQITNGTYAGTSSGDSSLTGPIRISVRATINTSDRLGTVDGIVVVGRPGRDTRAHLTGVYQDGNVSGLLAGEALAPGQRLLATFTASYSSDGGFGAGGIGSGTIDPAAVRSTEGGCKSEKPPTGQLKLVGGTVSALSDTSITISLVGGSSISCSVGDHTKAQVSRQHIAVGDRVSAACMFRSDAWMLLRIKKLK